MSDFDQRDFNNRDFDSNASWNSQPESGQQSNQPADSYFSQPEPWREAENRSYSYGAIPREPADRSGNNRDKKKGSFAGTIAKTIVAALIFGLISGACFAGVNKLIGAIGGETQTESTVQEKGNTTTDEAGGQTNVNVTTVDYTGVVEQTMPSVVAITGTFEQQGWFGQVYTGQGAGSGFIVEMNDNEILIGTNNHVVEGGTNLMVMFNDGTTAPATIVGTDKDADLGVISVKTKDVSEETRNAIKPATFSKEDVKVGQAVIAIGNALGYGQSVTTGVISAKDRRVSFSDGSMTLLQTDAAINPGNSGGMLINTKGEMVGVNNAKLEDTSVEGMGYAIPIARAEEIIADLKQAGSIDPSEQSYLGIVGHTVGEEYVQAYNIPAGVVVTSVDAGSPAEKAGLQAGDIITEFDGAEISTMEGLQKRIGNNKAGSKVKIVVMRKGENDKYEEKKLTATLGNKSERPEIEDNDQNQNIDPFQQPNENPYDDRDDGDNGGDQYDWSDILPYLFGR